MSPWSPDLCSLVQIGGPLGKIIEQITESVLIILCFVLLSPLEGFVLYFAFIIPYGIARRDGTVAFPE